MPAKNLVGPWPTQAPLRTTTARTVLLLFKHTSYECLRNVTGLQYTLHFVHRFDLHDKTARHYMHTLLNLSIPTFTWKRWCRSLDLFNQSCRFTTMHTEFFQTNQGIPRSEVGQMPFSFSVFGLVFYQDNEQFFLFSRLTSTLHIQKCKCILWRPHVNKWSPLDGAHE